MKKRIILGLILIVVFVTIDDFLRKSAIKKGKSHYEVFNIANIDNYIQSVRIAHKGSEMKLDDGRVFIFYPITDVRLNNRDIFNYTAEKGDKVVKESFSDTLYLIKGNKTRRYLFKKF